MNKIFKKVWNRRRGCFVAVSEAMSSAAQSSGKATVITAGLVLGLVSTPSYAIYKHIYAGESTAGQNLDILESGNLRIGLMRIFSLKVDTQICSVLEMDSHSLKVNCVCHFFLLKEMKLVWEKVFVSRKPFPKETEEEKGRKKPNRP